jgi:prophage tail gpP-like protein
MRVSIDETAPSYSVQFVKRIEEDLDVEDEEVIVDTIRYSDFKSVVSSRKSGSQVDYSDWGVRVIISPSNHNLNMQVQDLAESFYRDQIISSTHTSEDTILIFHEWSN